MSFILILTYLFFTFIRPQDWMEMFYDKPIVFIISMSALACIILERLISHKEGFSKVPQSKLMVGLYTAVLMSHIAHTYFAGFKMAFTTFLVVFVLFFILLNGINSSVKFKVAIWFIVFLITTLVFQGMYQIHNGVGWAGQGLTYQGGEFTDQVTRINWVGIFSDPNDLALTFVMAVGIVLAFLFGRTNFFVRIFSIFILVALLYGVYLTNSRGGIIALMAAVYFFFVRRTRKFFWGGIIGGLLAFAVLFFGPSRMGMVTATEASAYSRLELWYQGILMMKSNPVFGVGFNMFQDHLPQTAHNSYILAGAELGFVGLFFWVSLIYVSLKGLITVQNHVPELYNYALGLQSSLVGFCAAAFFLSRTYVILPYMFFALSGALMGIAKKRKPSLNFDFTKKDMKLSAFLSAGSIALAYAVVKFGI